MSKQKLIGILRKPERKEKAIVPGLVAVMQTNKAFFKQKKITVKKAWAPRRAPGEIWLMYKDVKTQSMGPSRKIISAWRYPGITKPGDPIPIPDDIKEELSNMA